MGVSYLSISAVCTLVSFVGLQYWTQLSLQKLTSDGLIGEDSMERGNMRYTLQLLLGSQATIALLATFSINVFILLILGLKSIFFVELHSSEIRKLGERLINYVIYKGAFLPLVIPPTIFQAVLWSTWLTVLCSLKMFQALARDRLERLNASPSATPWTYLRVYSVLLFVIASDLLWINLCLLISPTLGSSLFLLLFFEPLSIAFETSQAVVIHGFQLLDIWIHHTSGNGSICERSKLFDMSAAGSLLEWKGLLIRNLGFFLDMMTLLMAFGHYVHIWWLHGMAFHLVDIVLFLNIRALLSAIVKRIRGFIRLRIALRALHGALPDATSEEIKTYDDECAICREPMAKAKRLSCNHLFHLACLRSWYELFCFLEMLDQGLTENYSCPTCRKPLHAGRPEEEANPRAVDVSTDEQLARQISTGLDRHNPPGHTMPTAVFPNQMQNPLEGGAWRLVGPGLDSGWLNTWSGQGIDGAGPSTGIRPVGLGRVQMMMRHLAAVGETYAQTALEDSAWSLWPVNPSQAGTSAPPIPPAGTVRYPGGAGGLHIRTASRTANDNLANILAMAETVREVLPHMPDELIFQDLQRTNSVTVTVNNLLQM
ncbi:hypothetical protein RHGRI_008336 [Rhododendron griersonianum]|uniref:RING-type E3 ubiquitin transferase n=1 Tax=Rhododendron griersonianum TaxID=479676 RepID=A0AAV6L280_9ERIC|nr:hypothetical protein RHGRI_008336 [Rhododendron griersonianum]